MDKTWEMVNCVHCLMMINKIAPSVDYNLKKRLNLKSTEGKFDNYIIFGCVYKFIDQCRDAYFI